MLFWNYSHVFLLLIFSSPLLLPCAASFGDTHPKFIKCVATCRRTGCVIEKCIDGCGLPPPENGAEVSEEILKAVDAREIKGAWQLELFRWNCLDECKHQCMVAYKTAISGQETAVKFFGKWPFKRILGMQEPASVAFSVLNFLATLLGLLRFIHLVFFVLPRKPSGDKGPLFEYSGLFLITGLFSLNAWLSSTFFHARDTKATEAWDYSSAIALLAASLVVAIIRTAGLRLEAARVMVSAPVFAFSATHILYLNFYSFDYGWNIIVCSVMGILQLSLWLIWGCIVNHPARTRLILSTVGTALAMLLELFDFPPLFGIFDAHSFWHLATIPITILWWSFLREDARWRTDVLLGHGMVGKRKKLDEKKKE